MERRPTEAYGRSATQFPPFYVTEGSLPCSQQPATGPCPEPCGSRPEPLTPFKYFSLV
jgi:hypothetical protein